MNKYDVMTSQKNEAMLAVSRMQLSVNHLFNLTLRAQGLAEQFVEDEENVKGSVEA